MSFLQFFLFSMRKMKNYENWITNCVVTQKIIFKKSNMKNFKRIKNKKMCILNIPKQTVIQIYFNTDNHLLKFIFNECKII